jgi:hypothetical protein
MDLIACTGTALSALHALNGRVSCWLHIEDDARVDINSTVSQLLLLGCCHFAISGPNAEALHDEVDDAILKLENELILTTWHTGSLSESASEFLAVSCPGGDTPIRLVVVFAYSDQAALSILSEIVRLLNLTLD